MYILHQFQINKYFLTDVNKMPLGKLSQTQIAKGLEALLEIEDALKKKKGDLNALSSKFYTVVPHSFGRSVPPVINSQDIVDAKKEMMMTLSDIELTQSLQKSTNVSVQKPCLKLN